MKIEYRIKEVIRNKYNGDNKPYYIIQYRKTFLNGFIKTIWGNYKSYHVINFDEFNYEYGPRKMAWITQTHEKYYDKENIIEYVRELQQLSDTQYLHNKIIKTAECCKNDKSYYINLSNKCTDPIFYIGCEPFYRSYYEYGDTLYELKNKINNRQNKNVVVKYINV